MCKDCSATIEEELSRLAEQTGWPAQAVYEHEILYLAAKHPSPHYAPELAGRSRYTLSQMKRKLDLLEQNGYAKEAVDEDNATIAYTFPAVEYPRELYERNMAVICQFPAAVAEEMEAKVARIFFVLALMLVGAFVLLLFSVPMPVLAIAFLIGAPLVALKIWRRKLKPPEE